MEVSAMRVLGATVGVANIEKSRDGGTGEQFPFRLDVVDLGVDDDGDPVTTCVVTPTDVAAAKPTANQLGITS
jgi:hypothetical protein